jgi:hypothetical protein
VRKIFRCSRDEGFAAISAREGREACDCLSTASLGRFTLLTIRSQTCPLRCLARSLTQSYFILFRACQAPRAICFLIHLDPEGKRRHGLSFTINNLKPRPKQIMYPPTEAERQVIAKELLDVTHVATLSRYFKFYTSVTCPSTSEAISIQVDNPAFKTHADILACVNKLRLNPKLTRERFMSASLPDEGVSPRDKEDATRTVVRVGFMLDCSLKDSYSEGFEVGGYVPAKWELAEPFDSFVQRAVLRSSNNIPSPGFKEYKKDLKAWKLKKRHRLKFRPTDNIMEHLIYDPGARIVKIFHHTSYLKAQLARSIDEPIDLDAHSSLKL